METAQDTAVAPVEGAAPATLTDEERRAVYGFLANVLLAPIPVPGRTYAESLAQGAAALAAIPNVPTSTREAFDSLAAEVRADAEAAQQALALDRTMLFRGSRGTEGPLPPRESLYRTDRAERELLGDLNVFYARCGSGLAEGTHEAPDYLGVELAFMAELVRAALDGAPDDPETGQWESAQRDFAREHLGQWAPACCASLAAQARTDGFRGLLLLASDFLSNEAECFDIG